MGHSFVDEVDCGNFFDQIDDLIEFPPGNELGDGNLVSSDGCNDFTSMWMDTLPNSDPLFSGSHVDSAADLSVELSVPYDDIVQLEWLSSFMEDSFSSGPMTIGKENLCIKKELPSHKQFQISSPVSVLDSSRSSSSNSSVSIGKNTPLSSNHCSPQRVRSKRSHPTTCHPKSSVKSISPSSSIETGQPLNFTESLDIKKIPKLVGAEHKKKRKLKLSPSDPIEAVHRNAPMQAVRKCLHCEITKTPQWNACGVRYKSGRLFPEYRPAASPTFVPALHSNSHKKVVEMRRNVGLETQQLFHSLNSIRAPQSSSCN